MKRVIFTLVAVLAMTLSASAMSFSQARDQALFLTDKMAYELNLTADQYNAAYEINLDYILNLERSSDLYGIYWERRNTELSYVLTAAQYNMFLNTTYFHRPVTWTSNKVRFVIYDRYPKDRFFRAAPPGYQTYKGGNRYYDNSPYRGRTYDLRPGTNNGHGTGHTGTHGTVDYRKGNGTHGNNDLHKGTGNDHRTSTPTLTKKQAVNEGKAGMNSRRH